MKWDVDEAAKAAMAAWDEVGDVSQSQWRLHSFRRHTEHAVAMLGSSAASWAQVALIAAVVTELVEGWAVYAMWGLSCGSACYAAHWLHRALRHRKRAGALFGALLSKVIDKEVRGAAGA